MELEIMEVTNTARLGSKHYYKSDHVNIAFICSKMPVALVYGVYISRLI